MSRDASDGSVMFRKLPSNPSHIGDSIFQRFEGDCGRDGHQAKHRPLVHFG